MHKTAKLCHTKDTDPIGRAAQSRRTLHAEVMEMTSKELMYLEDALGHETFFRTKLKETLGLLQDETLRDCVAQMEQQHQHIFTDLYGLL